MVCPICVTTAILANTPAIAGVAGAAFVASKARKAHLKPLLKKQKEVVLDNKDGNKGNKK
jgi:hypothetical protein